MSVDLARLVLGCQRTAHLAAIAAAQDAVRAIDETLARLDSAAPPAAERAPSPAPAAPPTPPAPATPVLAAPYKSPLAPAASGGPAVVRTQPMWTPERRAVIAETWPTDTPTPEIMDRLNKLPGKPITEPGRVAVQAAEQGLKRPAGYLRRIALAQHAARASTAPTPQPAAAAPQPPRPASSAPAAPMSRGEIIARLAARPTGAVTADHDTIMRWAAARGFTEPMDLPAISRKREQLGLAPFVLAGRRSEGNS